VVHLQRARILRGLTQKQLAERSGMHPSILSRIESGKREASLGEVVRLANALHVPLEWFMTGKERPGTALPDIAAELWHLGIVDLIVPHPRVPGMYRPDEEVLTLAVGTERPEPRVIEALPAVLAWNRWRPGVLEAFARVTHPKALTRLAWLIEITFLLERTGGFPGGLVGADELTEFLTKVDRPHEPDNLGQAGGPVPDHRLWKYWRITYSVELSSFKERAERLWSLREGRKDA
jgi:transcriptional regulator with XRE-family HTH domain